MTSVPHFNPTVRFVLLLAAILCFAVFGFIGAGALHWTHEGAWLAGGLALLTGAQI